MDLMFWLERDEVRLVKPPSGSKDVDVVEVDIKSGELVTLKME